MSQNSIKVWDPLVRIFHWSLVIFFIIAFLTGDEDSSLHIYAGYAVIGLVLFRIIWGGIGTEHARFKDFIFGPSKVIQYLRSLASNSPRRYVGHNPAGGYMVVALLATLLVVTFTGLKVYGSEGHGPLAANNEISVLSTAKADEEDSGESNEAGGTAGKDGEKYWEEVHEAASYFMLGLIALHILGVVISSRKHKENLVKAMITGEKNID
jgi:cytochrome b